MYVDRLFDQLRRVPISLDEIKRALGNTDISNPESIYSALETAALTLREPEEWAEALQKVGVPCKVITNTLTHHYQTEIELRKLFASIP